LEPYSIIWSPTAKLSYYNILEYLEDKWTQKEILAFVKRTEQVINHIYNNPSLYPYSVESDTHKSVVVTQITLFYRVKDNVIELLIFWDSRQDLAKIAL
jgi:plasmid stabilization system protein ParE